MIRSILSLFIIGFLALTNLLSAEGLEFKESTFKHRATPGERSVSAVFEAVNKGDKTVYISGVRSSCSCTVSELSNKVIFPGQTTFIEARFTYGDRKGTHEKVVNIFTESDKDPIELRMKVEIPDWVKFERVVSWSRDEWSNKVERKLLVTIEHDQHNGVTLMDETGLFTVKVRPLEAGAELTLTPQAPVDQMPRLSQVPLRTKLQYEGSEFGETRSLFVMLRD